MAHSKGTWRIGKNGGTVVTDCLDGFEEKTGHGGQEAVDYYGGALIAESIMKKDDAKIIAAAPDLLNENIENLKFLEWLSTKTREYSMWSDKVQELYQRIESTRKAIKKATE